MLRRNLAWQASAPGNRWQSLRAQARQQLLADALRYTAAYRDVGWARALIDASTAGPRPIVMAGHQPTLFHPGVWFKNFVLSRIGQQVGGIAINLVIDNDVATGCTMRVPTLASRLGREGSEDIVYTSVPYDRAGGGVPFEQASVGDRELFDHFDVAVRDAILPLVPDPCVDQLWRHARQAIKRCEVAGCALAQARHGLEGDVGLNTLELPMSVVCRGPAFAQFVYWILSELPKFSAAYNQGVRIYRQAHGIRSAAHPVPDLHHEYDSDGSLWYEAPLWVYGNDSPTRKPVWVKIEPGQLTLSDRRGWTWVLDRRPGAADAASQLAAVASPHCKIRPRALLTTMYARSVLSDLFLHGIGGGKYDQLGDMIFQSFFGLEPPEFMVVSATIQLPGIQTQDLDAQLGTIQRRLRETQYQPENFADVVQLDPILLARKSQLLANIPPRGEKQFWHDEVSQINQRLSSSLVELRRSLRQQASRVRAAQESQSRLTSREHSFCLFPLNYLVDAFDTLLGRSSVAE